MWGSNPQQKVLETRALPIELMTLTLIRYQSLNFCQVSFGVFNSIGKKSCGIFPQLAQHQLDTGINPAFPLGDNNADTLLKITASWNAIPPHSHLTSPVSLISTGDCCLTEVG